MASQTLSAFPSLGSDAAALVVIIINADTSLQQVYIDAVPSLLAGIAAIAGVDASAVWLVYLEVRQEGALLLVDALWA